MNKKYKIAAITFMTCFVLLFAIPSAVQASNGGRPLWDRIVAGGSFTLASGEVLSGNLVVFGGDVVLEENSTVNGDVVLWGGSLDAAGVIHGDVLSLGGSGTLFSTAVIDGNLTQFGGSIERESGSTISGEILSGQDFEFNWFDTDRPFMGGFPQNLRDIGLDYSYMFGILWLLFVSLLMAALGIVVTLLFPNPTARIGHTSVSQVIVSWGLGFLTALVLPFLLVLLAITIVLFPITLIGFLGMAVAMFFGWIAIGYEIGHRFDEQLHLHWSPPVSAGLGTFILTLIAFGALRLIPCLGWVLPIMIVIPLGLGAVLLTRFGTQTYPLEEEARNVEVSSPPLSLPSTTSASPASQSSAKAGQPDTGEKPDGQGEG